MKTESDQAEVLLLDLERRVGVDQECSETVESQLKVLLVQQSRVHAPDNLVARTAKTLAACLGTRGDWAQAAQYAEMAANLEQRYDWARWQGGERPVRQRAGRPETSSSPRQGRTNRAGPARHSLGQSLRFLWKALRGSS